MNIKNRIRLSFFAIILLVICVGIFSVNILYYVKESNAIRDKIFQIVHIQGEMGEAVQLYENAKNKATFDHIKTNFASHEEAIQAIKAEISLDYSFAVLNILFSSKEEEIIDTQLKKLFENEAQIKTLFESMQKTRELSMKLYPMLSELLPREKALLGQLERKSKSFFGDFHVLRIFEQVRRYSSETLNQNQNEASFDKWTDYAKQLHERMENSDESAKYLKIVNQIGPIVIKIKDTDFQIDKILQNTRNILQENQQIKANITQMIEEVSFSVTKKAYVLLSSITIGLVGFLVFFAYIVTKKVGLSVDEIETQVHDGLREIQHLNQEISDTQKEVIFTMGAIGEQRSKETGNHVKRVAYYSKILALHYGLDEEEAEMLRQASPMHDIGKVAIPDAILNKPGRFEPHEREVMEKHAILGFEMLNSSNRPLLKMAAIVASQHHERWDGEGYPKGLKGEEIHIYGRITALADVFDALGSDRVYKKAWDNERIFALFKQERGGHFDPKLIDIFFDNLDEFLSIQENFKDT